MDEIDALIRGAAIGTMLVMAIGFLRTAQKAKLRRVGALFAAGVIAYLLWTHPGISDWPRLARLTVGVLSLTTPFFFWAMARLIFDDEFELRPRHWALLAVIVIAGVAQSVLPGVNLPWLPPALRLVFRFLLLALIVHVFWLVWRGWPADLVEKRLRFRLAFLIGTGVVAALVVLTALVYQPAAQWPMPARLGQAIASLALSIGLAAVLMRIDRDYLPLEGAAPTALPFAVRTGGMTALGSGEADQDAALMARLDVLMRDQETWKETGLTIGGLAARAATPEYRLRRLINQRLGFRNFTSFINEYRLAAAAARLADHEQVRIPVLTIALDLGWGSIGPFNRAFRARFGVTPTDYRRAQTGVTATDA
jgi:AraC-like DNA-binding protein